MKSLEQLLDDLVVRFIINSPEEELSSMERLGFLVEQAFWYYDDFYYDQNPNQLPKYTTLKAFAQAFYKHCPKIFPFSPQQSTFEQEFAKFSKYKSSIPVIGAVLIDESGQNVLLVQGYHAKSNMWTFPKGKINQNEKLDDCAKREVYEETSFVVGELLNPNNFIELVNDNQLIRLYVIENVPKHTKFFPRTRKEIKDIKWFNLRELLANMPTNLSIFLGKLKRYFKIKEERAKKAANEAQQKTSKKRKEQPVIVAQMACTLPNLCTNLKRRLGELQQIRDNLNSIQLI